jgi:uncharacterized protein (DUF58 family)
MTADVMQNERVSVRLKMLVNLAKKAAFVRLKKSRVRSSQSGQYISSIKGRGMEFDESRLYQPGDDVRNIDWRVTAKTNKTHCKVFREERERPVFISVDHRSSMEFATRGVFKYVQAAKAAALIAWSALQNGDRVGGQVFSENTCIELKPASGRRSVLHFLNSLVSFPVTRINTPVTLATTLKRLVQHVKPGSLVYIISDFRGLNDEVDVHLTKISRHCDVVLVHVFDPLERAMPDKGRYRFTDGMRDLIVDMSDKQRIADYQKVFKTRQERLQSLSKRYRIGLLSCQTNDDLLEVLG